MNTPKPHAPQAVTLADTINAMDNAYSKASKRSRFSMPITCTDKWCGSPSGLAHRPRAHHVTPLHAPAVMVAKLTVGKVAVN